MELTWHTMTKSQIKMTRFWVQTEHLISVWWWESKFSSHACKSIIIHSNFLQLAILLLGTSIWFRSWNKGRGRTLGNLPKIFKWTFWGCEDIDFEASSIIFPQPTHFYKNCPRFESRQREFIVRKRDKFWRINQKSKVAHSWRSRRTRSWNYGNSFGWKLKIFKG